MYRKWSAEKYCVLDIMLICMPTNSTLAVKRRAVNLDLSMLNLIQNICMFLILHIKIVPKNIFPNEKKLD